MGAGLTLLVLSAVSMVFVRIASVALRLTGLPDHIARFQSISALTGAGFTTTESEAIVNFPIRRRVIVGLMLFGNLGLVSVAATFIVAFSNKVGDLNAMAVQIITIVAAIVFIIVFMSRKTLDRLLCRFIRRVLQNLTDWEQEHYRILLALDDEYTLSEHVYRGDGPRTLNEIIPADARINVLSEQGSERRHIDETGPETPVDQNETLVCYGRERAQRDFAKYLATNFPANIVVNS